MNKNVQSLTERRKQVKEWFNDPAFSAYVDRVAARFGKAHLSLSDIEFLHQQFDQNVMNHKATLTNSSKEN